MTEANSSVPTSHPTTRMTVPELQEAYTKASKAAEPAPEQSKSSSWWPPTCLSQGTNVEELKDLAWRKERRELSEHCQGLSDLLEHAQDKSKSPHRVAWFHDQYRKRLKDTEKLLGTRVPNPELESLLLPLKDLRADTETAMFQILARTAKPVCEKKAGDYFGTGLDSTYDGLTDGDKSQKERLLRRPAPRRKKNGPTEPSQWVKSKVDTWRYGVPEGVSWEGVSEGVSDDGSWEGVSGVSDGVSDEDSWAGVSDEVQCTVTLGTSPHLPNSWIS